MVPSMWVHGVGGDSCTRGKKLKARWVSSKGGLRELTSSSRASQRSEKMREKNEVGLEEEDDDDDEEEAFN